MSLQKNQNRVFGLFSLLTMSLLLALHLGCASKAPAPQGLLISKQLYQSKKFIPHADKGPMHSYLAMNIDFEVLSALRKQIEGELHISLKNRGEGHITVISPVEFDKVLAAKLSMKDIQAIAEKMKIQETSFKPVCVGRGNLTVNGHDEQTYYLVIQSEGLFKIRQEVQKLFVAKGGSRAAFDPDLYYPHATIGYTSQDLHYEDGIIKDERSCIFKLREEK